MNNSDNNNCSNSINNSNNRNKNNTNKKNQKVKNPESYEKRVLHPLEQAPEKIESFIPPSFTRTVLAVSKYITPSAKSFMDAKVARRRDGKKARLQKQLDENTEKTNVIIKPKLK